MVLASPAHASHLGIYGIFGSDGTAGGQFAAGAANGPHGLAVNYSGEGTGAEAGDVYVADRNNHRIQQFTADGEFVRAWGQDVVSGGSNGFEICEVSAECKAGLNTPATGGSMNQPVSVAVDQADGSVYVFDGANLRIQKFTAAGTFIWASGKDVLVGGVTSHEVCTVAAECKIGVNGALGGEIGVYSALSGRGLAVAPGAGAVYVADAGNKRVQELTPAGAFARAFGWDVLTGGSTEFEQCVSAPSCKVGIGGSAGVGQFGGSGAPLLPANQGPNSISVDSSGAIYTAERNANTPFRVQKFTPDGATLTPAVFAPAILGGTSTATAPNHVAVDPTNGDVYVAKSVPAGTGDPPASAAEQRVLQLNSDGSTLLHTHLAGAGIDDVKGLALDPANDRILISSSTGGQRVYVFGEVSDPAAELTEVNSVTSTSANVKGIVNPNGGGLETTYRVEYSNDGRRWVAATAEFGAGNGEVPVSVELEVTGLPPSNDLQIRLVATKPFVGSAASNAIAIRTQGASPTVETGIAWWNGPAELALTGTVNPNSLDTTYYFQYGPTDSYGNSVPLDLGGEAGAGGKSRQVAEQLYDLSPDTAIHYRLVAVNAFGTAVGADRVVAAQDESQVYELVSNGESNGLGIRILQAVSDDGRRVLVDAQTLGDAPSLPGQFNEFVAELGSDRWGVPPLGPDPSWGSTTAVGEPKAFTADLGSMLFPQRTTIEGRAQEAQWSLSHVGGSSNLASPRLVPLARRGELSANQGASFAFQDGSADVSNFVFKKVIGTEELAYVPGEPLVPRGYVLELAVNLYQITGAGPDAPLTLVNRDESGIPISNVCGAWLGSLNEGSFSEDTGRSVRTVSSDGSVVYFSARPGAPTTGSCAKASFPLRIYKRIDDSATVAVSASQCDRATPTPCGSQNGDDVFQGASLDGETVFFTSPRQLTNSDEDSTGDLYLYDADPPAGQPTLVQASAGEATTGHPNAGSGAEVQGVVESSTDGSRIYFVAKGQLTAEATQGASNLFVYERNEEYPGGRLSFIGSLNALDASSLWGFGENRSAYAMPFRGADGSDSGDGRRLVFVSRAPLLPDDADVSPDLYRYDHEADELICISCAGDGAFDVQVKNSPGGAGPSLLQQSRIASEDSSTVAFSSTEQLLPEDQNDVQDAYVWRNGQLSLVSGATGGLGAVGDAMISPDGSRVFFVTSAALHPSDENSAQDVYAATVGGGLFVPREESSGCEDAAGCRADPPPPPPASVPSTPNFTGPGNVVSPQPKSCTRPKVRRKGRCAALRCKKPKVKRKGRCVKPKNAGQMRKGKRAASHDRGGKR